MERGRRVGLGARVSAYWPYGWRRLRQRRAPGHTPIRIPADRDRMAPPLVRERVEDLEQRVLELEKAMAILLAAPNWSDLPPAPQETS